MVEGQVLVLDGPGHLLGHLVAIVAKQVLLGQEMAAVCREGINISGNFYRNNLKYLVFLLNQLNANSSWSTCHFQVSSLIFWQTRQGMPPQPE